MSLAEKYSRLAHGFSERSYVDVEEFMGHRLDLVLNWGKPLKPGDRLLELGCADGYLGCLLAKHGIEYVGIDIAQGMIEAARERAQTERVNARFLTMDMNNPDLEGTFDAIIALPRTFFKYAEDPLKVLSWMRSKARKKIVVDWNHLCSVPLNKAVEYVREAGFGSVAVRPFLVPTRRNIPKIMQRVLYILESWPRIGLLLTRNKFLVLIKGEP